MYYLHKDNYRELYKAMDSLLLWFQDAGKRIKSVSGMEEISGDKIRDVLQACGLDKIEHVEKLIGNFQVR